MGFEGLKNLRNNAAISRLSTALTKSMSHIPGTGIPIAIEFGTASLKILQITGDPPALVAAASLDTPDELVPKHQERLAMQIEALPRLIKRGGFKGKRAVCAIPAWATFCKPITIVRDGTNVANLIANAIPLQLGIDPAALVYRYIEVTPPDRPGKGEVIIQGVARDLVERLMRTIAACKLQPVGMHTEFAAAVRSFDYVMQRTEDLQRNTLYLDIGAMTTKVMIAHGKDLAFARVVEMGGRHLDEIVAMHLRCDLAYARKERNEVDQTFTPAAPKVAKAAGLEASKADGGASSTGGGATVAIEQRGTGQSPAGFTREVLAEPAAAMAPQSVNLTEPLETITDEVLMCLRYHASQFPGKRVDRAVFIGGEARHRGLCQHIARTLKLPAQMADPMARVARTGQEPTIGVDLKQAQPGWAVALGLCLSPTDL